MRTSKPRLVALSFIASLANLSLVALSIVVGSSPSIGASQSDSTDLARQFTTTVRPFLERYCIGCHGGAAPAGHFDLRAASSVAAIVQDDARWSLLIDRVSAGAMPPAQAKAQPGAEERKQIIDVVASVLKHEALKHAGDPGVVLVRRLSNAEYNYTIDDLTGVDIRPAREFPVDPANPAGFDNSGESLVMSPALLAKYLIAAREVSDHLVLTPTGMAFAPHPMLVETDRDKYCVNRIIDAYHWYSTDYAAYFQAAWRFKHRARLGRPKATLWELASQSDGNARLSPKYLATIWRTLERRNEEVGPIAKLQAMWRRLPGPGAIVRALPEADGARGAERGAQDMRRFATEPWLARRIDAGTKEMRDVVVELRKKIVPKVANISISGISPTAQPFLIWRNRQYAANRRTFDRGALTIGREGPDPDLLVPAGARARYEAEFARFSAVFPDAFYISERGRYFPDTTRDTGRLLSAGFHNVMGYFRDDGPYYDLILDEGEQKQLDARWSELDFVALANVRTYVQFYLNESGQARARGGDREKPSAESDGARPLDADIASKSAIERVERAYLAKARPSNNPTAIKAIEDHFQTVNTGIRAVEQARRDAEPRHLAAVLDFAARAFRRPLTPADRQDLTDYYQSLRNRAGMGHEDAMRDLVASVLMSPDFCYRLDLAPQGSGILPLSDLALASRLSYFLWSSMPDGELLAHAAAGDLHRPEVIAAEARRMLKDARTRHLAAEFGGAWLDFRRFEEHNAVDRDRFPAFTNELRQAMFEEPIRFILDVIQNDRSTLDFLYARDTFVNAALSAHYGMAAVQGGPDRWVRVDDADRFERGGLLPMAVFLTKNAPGLRTSPVKRGYWFVKQVLGERIPPPPAAVPELPRDEARMDLPLRDVLARHRQDTTCAACHARFDAFGLAFEGYGPVGERRIADLAGRPVDTSATFPGGNAGTGVEGLRRYVRDHRQVDFVDNLSRKLLAYALGRSLTLSDSPTIEELRTRLEHDGYRFGSLVEGIVTSRQFLTSRGSALVTAGPPAPHSER